MSRKKSEQPNEEEAQTPNESADLTSDEAIPLDDTTQPLFKRVLNKNNNNNDNAPISEEVEVNIEKITSAMATFKAEAERNLEGWQRERAEFQNYKRRVERDQKDIQRRSELDTIIKVLPIVDDFERALANIPSDLLDNGWVHGTALILNKFKKLFEEYEITMINPANEPFDPYLHQAIMREDSSEVESGHIIETLQKGYKSGDTILRPALVKVAN